MKPTHSSDETLAGPTLGLAMSDTVFQYEQVGDILVVTAQGDLFQYRYEDLRNGYNDTYRRLLDETIKHLVFDFAAVGHFGSSFIGMLIKLAQKVRKEGGEALLCSLTAEMKEVLQNLMLLENVKTDFFWVPFDTRAEAIAKLQANAG